MLKITGLFCYYQNRENSNNYNVNLCFKSKSTAEFFFNNYCTNFANYLEIRLNKGFTLGRVIGIDYGKKRVGLAVTDPLKIIATGLDTIENARIFEYLEKYCKENEVEVFVVGYPLNMDYSKQEMTNEVEKFIQKIIKKFPGIPVQKIDERLTSRMAFQTMIDAGIKKMKRRDKALVDKISATIILQSYLESKTK